MGLDELQIVLQNIVEDQGRENEFYIKDIKDVLKYYISI